MPAHRVSIYVREPATRAFKAAKPNKAYDFGTTFYLRYTDPTTNKQKWEAIKECVSFKTARGLAVKKQGELMLNRGLAQQAPALARLTVVAALEKFLEHASNNSRKTWRGYTYSLGQFRLSCAKTFLDEIDKTDLGAYVAAMRLAGLSDRTAHNRVSDVVAFLRYFDITNVRLKVAYTEKVVRAYRPDELTAMFSVATPEEEILFQFFLCTGVREQEAMYAEWDDLDFVDGIFTVKAKGHWNPKDREEREVPIPDFLVAALKQRMLHTAGKLIFPSPTGKPDGHMLRHLKELAQRAGLDPETCGLHKFRKTWATLQHKAGLDARTIQKRLGHSDLATTLAYLEGEEARSNRSREQVNGTFGFFFRQGLENSRCRLQ
jgi:integrase